MDSDESRIFRRKVKFVGKRRKMKSEWKSSGEIFREADSRDSLRGRPPFPLSKPFRKSTAYPRDHPVSAFPLAYRRDEETHRVAPLEFHISRVIIFN